ncbi:twin-arginine translocase subunit TatC [Paenibacillus aurantius]|uniref:Sec-independent protein translocase protein TatC n=1 Tax=Paenibacillus aurantius TaxID=2918900 RepID=A0AA96RE30_9BACL|nr:twin-arginine translocase subunit TatC [Paenibacillus aurantius]WJH35172.1 twin-arginine translocase subunit TatC [Paenibacillus sp. CC-CFT747]WNQ10437.1 twin-arginine translocase subunit TatC [Paenibacillus aurantius]
MEEDQMSLVDHLGELRRRIMWVAAVLVVTMVAGFFIAVPALDYLKSIPPATGISWHALAPGDGIRVYFQFAFLFAVAVTLPFTLYHLWAFVKPGLREEEQKATIKYIPFSVLLFLAGFSFAYFVVFRLALAFTTSLNERMSLIETYGITQYFTFMFNILLPVSLVFELPVVVMFLTKLRVLNPIRLRKLRRYSYLILVILSTLIAPPDLLSNLLIVLPLIILYEISVVLSGRIYRRQLEQDREWEEEYGPK